MLDHLDDLSTPSPGSLTDFLRDIGLTRTSRTVISAPAHRPSSTPSRDVSWFLRGEECPH